MKISEEDKQDLKIFLSHFTPVNTLILIINIIYFLFLYKNDVLDSAIGMAKYGALNFELAITENEYWRFLTSMFMHYNYNHIFGNMVLLIFVGGTLEKAIGKIKYLIIYLSTGIISGIVSVFWYMLKNELVVSAGASGAIFGVVGALIYVVFRNKGQLYDVTFRQLVFMALITIVNGISQTGIDNMAHIGGFLSGIILSILLYRKKY